MTDDVVNSTMPVSDPYQSEAIRLCCDISNRLVSVTGSAGTGKTSILETIYHTLVEAGYQVALCSPTGKAAKNIFDRTGIKAQTIHSLLEYTHPGDIDDKTGKPIGLSYPRRDRTNPLEYDVILADEYAMVSVELHSNLLAALKTGACIRLFGDNRQLEPIEEGSSPWDKSKPKEPSSFMKCLNNPKLPSVVLKTVFRQGKDSGILANLEMILKGRTPIKNDQWSIKFTDQPVKFLEEYILDHYFNEDVSDEDRIDFSKITNQIIVPQNISWVGTHKLNFLIQALFHDYKEPHLLIPRHKWDMGNYVYNDQGNLVKKETKGEEGGQIKLFIGDKVLFKANNADLQVFNGETGTVIEYSQEYGDVTIDFGDREQTIPPVQIGVNKYGKTSEFDPRRDIDLAYAITTHKSQGSQYEHVVYVMNKSNKGMLNNRNIYTACARAKKHVMLITDQDCFTYAVNRRG